MKDKIKIRINPLTKEQENSWNFLNKNVVDDSGWKRVLNRLKAKCFYNIEIEDFHIGFEYEELQMDGNRYLNQGMIWVKKTYGFTSPRLHKMQKLIEELKIRKPKK